MKKRISFIVLCVFLMILMLSSIAYAANGNKDTINLDKIKKEAIKKAEIDKQSATLYLTKQAPNGSVSTQGTYPGGILSVSYWKYPGYYLQSYGYCRFDSTVGPIWYLQLTDRILDVNTMEQVWYNFTYNFGSETIDDFVWATVPHAGTYKLISQCYAQNYDGSVGTTIAGSSAYIY